MQPASSIPYPTRSFESLRRSLDTAKIHSSRQAHLLCRLIPARCPFERKVQMFNRTLIAIPPLCKLNPFYQEVMMLRFKALSYLAEAGEDISVYCQEV